MLLDRQRRLLTASVDGELTDRQQVKLAHLLQRSEEARQLLHRLQADAQSLHQFSPPSLPVDLSSDILRSIQARQLVPGLPKAKVLPFTSRLSPFIPWASAAAVLLVLGAVSYLYFAVSLTQPAGREAALKQSQVDPGSRPTSVPEEDTLAEPNIGPSEVEQTNPPKKDHSPQMGQSAVAKRFMDKPKNPAAKSTHPPSKQETVLTDRLEMFRFSKVDDSLPVIFKLGDLGQSTVRRELLAELGKHDRFRLELPCRNGSKALERLQTAAKAVHLELAIEKHAKERMQLPKLKTNYLVYLEDVTPEEVADLLRRIGDRDGKIAARKPAEAQFDRLVLTALTPKDHKELAVLIGIDPTMKKPTAENTAPHLALVLALHLVRTSPSSGEIKRFLENRKSSRPGTIRLLLVLRS